MVSRFPSVWALSHVTTLICLEKTSHHQIAIFFNLCFCFCLSQAQPIGFLWGQGRVPPMFVYQCLLIRRLVLFCRVARFLDRDSVFYRSVNAHVVQRKHISESHENGQPCINKRVGEAYRRAGRGEKL